MVGLHLFLTKTVVDVHSSSRGNWELPMSNSDYFLTAMTVVPGIWYWMYMYSVEAFENHVKTKMSVTTATMINIHVHTGGETGPGRKLRAMRRSKDNSTTTTVVYAYVSRSGRWKLCQDPNCFWRLRQRQWIMYMCLTIKGNQELCQTGFCSDDDDSGGCEFS